MTRITSPLLANAALCLTVTLPVIASMTVAAPTAAAAQEAPATQGKSASSYPEHYRIDYLGEHVAEQLAWEQCAGRECSVMWDSGRLVLVADRATQERMVRALAQADIPQSQSFLLTVLAADDRAGASAAGVPEAAQKALRDIRGFLPFKGYRLLDVAWMRTTETASAQIGGDGITYEAQLRFKRVGEPAAKELVVEFGLRAEVPRDNAPAAAGRSTDEHPSRLQLIGTNFNVHAGETVVVGTSKVGANTPALVVLLTAAP